ncbi:MAG TPA: hypothetical protein VMJ34_22330 [Bryobacteraceae bacterium]|nr:hypothetical protein [Bryobacteraceae bacterium]
MDLTGFGNWLRGLALIGVPPAGAVAAGAWWFGKKWIGLHYGEA